MDEPIYLPTLSHWEYDNVWSGERGQARYYITPADGEMTAQMWRGPKCRELSEILLTAQFPICEEGIETMRSWLLEGIHQINTDGPAGDKQ